MDWAPGLEHCRVKMGKPLARFAWRRFVQKPSWDGKKAKTPVAYDAATLVLDTETIAYSTSTGHLESVSNRKVLLRVR